MAVYRKNSIFALKLVLSHIRLSTTNHIKSQTFLFRCGQIRGNHLFHTCITATHVISSFLQKGFSEITDEKVGKSLHAICVKSFRCLDVFHTNTLINMYAKFGKIDVACYLFDQMPLRDDATWNTMISAFVRVCLYRDSLLLFGQMRTQGFQTSCFVTATLLTACSRSAKDRVLEGFQIHCLVLKNGLSSNVFAGTALLNFYAAYGFHSSAKRLFEEMPERNVVSWTSLMVGYSNDGNAMEVINIYQRMRREEVSCNHNTFTIVITSCGSVEDESLGHQVLGQVIKCGLETDLSVSNSLVSMFGDFGRVEEASFVFKQMNEQDTISWNSMISAYAHNDLIEDSFRCFNLMRHTHEDLDSITLSALLSACRSADSLQLGRAVHGLVHKLGLHLNLCVCNTLLGMYSGTGRSKDMEQLFEEMPEKDVISWNSLIAGHVEEGKYLFALKVFIRLLRTRNIINHVTLASALAACSDPVLFVETKIIHAIVFISGLCGNLIVENALITTYGKHRMMWEAEQVFQKMAKRDLVTWNALIGGYADCDEPDQAFNVFKMLRRQEEPKNYITMVNVLSSCAGPSHLLRHGMPLHAHIILTGFESDDYVKNSLITMYAKCNDLNSSNYIFDGFVNKNYVSWNAIVAANAYHGHGEEALKRFSEMNRIGMHLDQFSFSAALAAASDLAALEEGQQLHGMAFKLGLDSHQYVKTSTTDMYGKCGEMNDVVEMLPEPNKRPRVLWNILISAFARQGCFQEARETFHEMVRLGLKPDHVTFVSLLSACSHGGLVEEGLAYYSSMTKEFGVPVAIEHCVCMIDLLGRSGRLSEALAFIKEMPIPPNDFIWRSLLAACRTHGNKDVGKQAADHLLESNPSDDSAYVLYSNVCATTGRWEEVENLREEMESGHIKKKPACSWIKLKRKVSSFAAGDKSHPQTLEIHAKLEELKRKIKHAGYVPDTSFALQDTDEEQKEQHLWNHSERLALAYGLISTPGGSTMQVFKNLRVCGDCHSVFKFISNTERRKIILRDPFRFHHFQDGKCSCSDYW